MSEEKFPRVGVSAFVYRDDKLLFGKRLKLYGRGKLQIAGGHLEYGESFEVCVARELMEETGLTLAGPVQMVDTMNMVVEDPPVHFVSVVMLARHTRGELPAEPPEPDKCAWWKWFGLDRLPDPAEMFEVGPLMPRLLRMLKGEQAVPVVGRGGVQQAIQDYKRLHPQVGPTTLANLFGVSLSTANRALKGGGLLMGRSFYRHGLVLSKESREEVRRLHFEGEEGGRRLTDQQLAERFGTTLAEVHAALIRID